MRSNFFPNCLYLVHVLRCNKCSLDLIWMDKNGLVSRSWTFDIQGMSKFCVALTVFHCLTHTFSFSTFPATANLCCGRFLLVSPHQVRSTDSCYLDHLYFNRSSCPGERLSSHRWYGCSRKSYSFHRTHSPWCCRGYFGMSHRDKFSSVLWCDFTDSYVLSVANWPLTWLRVLPSIFFFKGMAARLCFPFPNFSFSTCPATVYAEAAGKTNLTPVLPH